VRICQPVLIFVQRLVPFGAGPAGRESIYRKAVFPPIVGEAHSELANSTAAFAIPTTAGRARDRAP
jgi:hypothetical protein